MNDRVLLSCILSHLSIYSLDTLKDSSFKDKHKFSYQYNQTNFMVSCSRVDP